MPSGKKTAKKSAGSPRGAKRATNKRLSPDDSPSPIVITPTSWKVSYGLARSLGWLAYLIDLHIHACVEGSLHSRPTHLLLGTPQSLCQTLGLRTELPGKQLAEALHQLVAITVKRNTLTVDERKTSRESTTWYRLYEARFEQNFVDGHVEETLQVRLLDPFFEYWGEWNAQPLNTEYQQQLPPAANRLYTWLSYRLYGAALEGCPTATFCYSDYCRYASQPRQIAVESVRAQMEVLHEPHFQSGYLAEATYEPAPDTDGLPDWNLTYRGGERAHREFLQFCRRGIRVVLPEPDLYEPGFLVLPAEAEAVDSREELVPSRREPGPRSRRAAPRGTDSPGRRPPKRRKGKVLRC